MLLLHLCAMPNSMDKYNTVLRVFDKNIEYYVGNIGGICVGMFLFLSGYGMYKNFNKNFRIKDIFNRIKKLYINYLIVFFLFIPIGILKGSYTWNLEEFLANLVLISETYCYEWWFLQLYIIILLFYPILLFIINKYKYKYIILISFFIEVIGMGLTKLSYMYDRVLPIHWICIFLGNQFLFVLGMIIQREGLFDKFNRKYSLPRFIYILITIILIIFLIFSIEIPVIGELIKVIITPILIYTFLNIIKEENNIYKTMVRIGRHSTNIWMTHTLIGVYIFSEIAYIPRYSLLVISWVMILSIISSILINKIQSYITIYKNNFIGNQEIKYI